MALGVKLRSQEKRPLSKARRLRRTNSIVNTAGAINLSVDCGTLTSGPVPSASRAYAGHLCGVLAHHLLGCAPALYPLFAVPITQVPRTRMEFELRRTRSLWESD